MLTSMLFFGDDIVGAIAYHLYLEGIVAGRQIRVVRLVVIAGINPCIVESSHLVEVMDALVVVVVDGRKGDAEAVLFVA